MVQNRNIALCVVLTLVTCGIYGIYWFICLTDDTNYAAQEQNAASGVVAFLLTLVTCNIYGIYWAYKQGEKIDKIRQAKGLPSSSSNNSVLYLILELVGFGIIAWALMQNELNQLASDAPTSTI